MTRPHVQATIDDGPRQGETIVLDPGKDNAPPREILLPDGHLGARGPGEEFHRPTAVNLIEGRMRELIVFLDELAQGPGGTPGLAEQAERWRVEIRPRLGRKPPTA